MKFEFGKDTFQSSQTFETWFSKQNDAKEGLDNMIYFDDKT